MTAIKLDAAGRIALAVARMAAPVFPGLAAGLVAENCPPVPRARRRSSRRLVVAADCPIVAR